ncbi:unnamed protein product [Soboliphyme baturini]|uniref:Uracil phosphoribosyltransferase homolog n=1 Tax=Soboliphyme baturini TaxID=241478 RepID=A0A183IGY8_9BILA|nr:unnamed protein product [Soboliphyme baturini]
MKLKTSSFRDTTPSDFVFSADRLVKLYSVKVTQMNSFLQIRCVVEESLNLLPYIACKIVTPTGMSIIDISYLCYLMKPGGCTYEGVEFSKGNCGVSIIRSGEVMEKGLRECCRSIRIGKILVQKSSEADEVQIVYAKLISDIHKRKVLLMYPIMNTGNTVIKAVDILRDHKCDEQNIILMNLFCTPSSKIIFLLSFRLIIITE